MAFLGGYLRCPLASAGPWLTLSCCRCTTTDKKSKATCICPVTVRCHTAFVKAQFFLSLALAATRLASLPAGDAALSTSPQLIVSVGGQPAAHASQARAHAKQSAPLNKPITHCHSATATAGNTCSTNMCSNLHHAPCVAAHTHPSPLARIRYQKVLAAHLTARARANPCARMPHSKYFRRSRSTYAGTWSTTQYAPASSPPARRRASHVSTQYCTT